MRIPREYYDVLKKLEAQQGRTKEIDMRDLHEMAGLGLIKEMPELPGRYAFEITAKGQAGLDDRPIENPAHPDTQ